MIYCGASSLRIYILLVAFSNPLLNIDNPAMVDIWGGRSATYLLFENYISHSTTPVKNLLLCYRSN